MMGSKSFIENAYARLAGIEKRPFCFCNFSDFVLNGTRYIMTHEVFRYKISTFMKEDLVQLGYYSGSTGYPIRN
jgi:hypothetical protein